MIPPRLRWFRFRLRTLFVLIAICTLLITLAPEVWLVCARRTALSSIQQRGGSSAVTGVYASAEQIKLPISRLRSWLGDEKVYVIIMPSGAARSEILRVQDLFPEAMVNPAPVKETVGFM